MVDPNFLKAAARLAEQDRQDGVMRLVTILSRASDGTMSADDLRAAALRGSDRLGMTALRNAIAEANRLGLICRTSECVTLTEAGRSDPAEIRVRVAASPPTD